MGMDGRDSRSDLPFEFTLVGVSDYYGEQDPRSADEAMELGQLVDREFPGSLRDAEGPGGTKGFGTELVVLLGQSGALTVLGTIISTWIGQRPKHRSVSAEVRVKDPDGAERTATITIDATNVDSKSLAEMTRAALNDAG